MTRKKTILFIILVIILTLACAVNAADTGTEAPIAEGKGWVLSADGKMTVTAEARLSAGNRADIEWYDYMDQILSVEIEEGVKRIGNYAFCDAVNLSHITLPQSLESIGLRAFSHCESLQTLTLPGSLESIDYWAFAGCSSLEQVVIAGDAFTELDNYAFQGCPDLLRVVITAPVERLGFDTLENCTSMKELYLPAGLKLIDIAALNNCPELTDIYYAGTENQWNEIRIEQANDAVSRAEVHCSSLWDPQSADHISLLRPVTPKTRWIRIANRLQMTYSGDDFYGFVNNNLDGQEKLLAAADTDRETMDSFLKDHNDEVILIPRGDTFEDLSFHLIVKVGMTDFERDASLAQLRRDLPEETAAYLDLLEERIGLTAEPEFTEKNGMEFALYRDEEYSDGTYNAYITVLDGCGFVFFFCRETGMETPGGKMEADIMENLTHYSAQQTAAPTPTVPAAQPEASASMQEYTFMDGRLTIRMDTDAFDVFTQNNEDNKTALQHQGFNQAQMDWYMQGLGYQLTAVPVGEPFIDSRSQFLLHAKDPAYPGISNLKDLSAAEERNICSTIVKSFGITQWELVQTDAVDYFVFEALGSIRYATIVNEQMVYFYVKAGNGIVTDEQRQMLQSIMENVTWDL